MTFLPADPVEFMKQVGYVILAVATLYQTVANSLKLKSMEIKVDGRLSELLEVSKSSSHAEGVQAGGDAARQDAANAMATAAAVEKDRVLSASGMMSVEPAHVIIDTGPTPG